MNKLWTFFRTFYKSFTSPTYYAEVVQAKFSFSLKFFFFYFFLFALATTAYLTPVVFLPLNREIKKLPDKILQIYPADLVITIKKGQVSTNAQEPYSIPFPKDPFPTEFLPPEDYLEINGGRQPLKNLSSLNLLTIDTKAQVTDIKKYNTIALLTKDSLSFVAEQGEIRTYPLTEVKDLTINKLLVFSVVQVAAPYLRFVVPALAALVFLGVLTFLPIAKMIYLLLFSVLTLIMGKLIHLNLSYGKYYQVGLHATVVWSTLEGVIRLANLKVQVPFLGTIFMLFFTILALYGVKQGIQPPALVPAVPLPPQTPPVPPQST